MLKKEKEALYSTPLNFEGKFTTLFLQVFFLSLRSITQLPGVGYQKGYKPLELNKININTHYHFSCCQNQSPPFYRLLFKTRSDETRQYS